MTVSFSRCNHERFRAGITLPEVLIVVAIVGVLSAIAVTSYSDFRTQAEEVVVTNNALEVDNVSGALALEGVAHVIPDSLGGKEATLRFLQVGVTVQREGRLSTYGVNSLSERHIPVVSNLLEPVFDTREVRLDYQGPQVDEETKNEFADYLVSETPTKTSDPAITPRKEATSNDEFAASLSGIFDSGDGDDDDD